MWWGCVNKFNRRWCRSHNTEGEHNLALGGLCLHIHTPPLPNLNVLSNAMPNSKMSFYTRSTVSVGQLLLFMGCVTGLQVSCKWILRPTWEFVVRGGCASMQTGWSCVGVSLATCDMAIISRSSNNRDAYGQETFCSWSGGENGLLLNRHDALNERFGWNSSSYM